MSNIKIAQIPKPRSHRTVNAPTAPVATQAPSAGVSSSVAAVKEMQKSILEFANVASSSDVTSMRGNQTGKQQAGQEYLGGSDPFGDFLATSVRESSPTGQQYLNVDVKSPNRSNTGIEDTGLRGIIDTIKRIGTPGSQGTEKSVDGVWGERTNNALKNISALANAMLHLANDMGISMPGLTDSTVETFNKYVPEKTSDLTENKKTAIAQALTKQIQNLSKVFGYFRKTVLENKQYRSYIDQNKSFIQYKQREETKDGRATLSDQEKKMTAGVSTTGIPDVRFSNVKNEANNWVSLNDLNNMDSFSQLMSRLGRDPKDTIQVKNTLNEITQALNAKQEKIDPGY